jgi:hypothetical protein
MTVRCKRGIGIWTSCHRTDAESLRCMRPRTFRSLVALVVASLMVVGGAFAASGGLIVTGPGKTVPANATYTITVSGDATQAATRLWAFQGAVGSGPSAKCYATVKEELAYNGLGPKAYPVSGPFKQTIQYPNASTGPKMFCAFLANKRGSVTYAHAGTTSWTNE